MSKVLGEGFVPAKRDGKVDEVVQGIIMEGPDPSTIRYLVLSTLYNYADDPDDEISLSFDVIIGRQATYEYLKLQVMEEYLDPMLSYIGGEDTKVGEMKTVRWFLKTMKEQEKVFDPSDFDVDEYVEEEIPENETIMNAFLAYDEED